MSANITTQEYDVRPDKLSFIVGKVDCLAMRQVAGKDKKSEGLREVCGQWFEEMKKHATSCPPVANPWTTGHAVAAIASVDAGSNCMLFDHEGAPIDARKTILQRQGIVPGARVARKSIMGTSLEVTAVSSAGAVTMQTDGGGRPFIVVYDLFVGEYV